MSTHHRFHDTPVSMLRLSLRGLVVSLVATCELAGIPATSSAATSEEIARFQQLTQRKDFLARRVESTREVIADSQRQVASLEASLQKELAVEAQKDDRLISSLALSLYMASARLESARLKEWQAQTSLELSSTDAGQSDRDQLTSNYIRDLESAKDRTNVAIQKVIERVDPMITDKRVRTEFEMRVGRKDRR